MAHQAFHAILAGSCSHHMGFLSVFEHATLIPALSLDGPSLIFPRDLLFTTKSQLKHLLSEIFLKETTSFLCIPGLP